MGRGDGSPWDLTLEVIDILGEPGCGWHYQVGFETVWDGRHFPEGMCPFAWNAFSPWVWALRYADVDVPGPWADERGMVVVCPDPRHSIVWRISRRGGTGATREPGREETTLPLLIEVVELPKGPGCERAYQVGDRWLYDGELSRDLCPLALNALNLWIWPLQYGASPQPMGWSGRSVEYNCPAFEHPVVFRVVAIDDQD
jgi:uncharacterized repeat protein (TIGR04076 family)